MCALTSTYPSSPPLHLETIPLHVTRPRLLTQASPRAEEVVHGARWSPRPGPGRRPQPAREPQGLRALQGPVCAAASRLVASKGPNPHTKLHVINIPILVAASFPKSVFPKPDSSYHFLPRDKLLLFPPRRSAQPLTPCHVDTPRASFPRPILARHALAVLPLRNLPDLARPHGHLA